MQLTLTSLTEEEFWRRKTDEWVLEEQQVKLATGGLTNAEATDRALDAQRVFETRE